VVVVYHTSVPFDSLPSIMCIRLYIKVSVIIFAPLAGARRAVDSNFRHPLEIPTSHISRRSTFFIAKHTCLAYCLLQLDILYVLAQDDMQI
jgi:hypothetical protein